MAMALDTKRFSGWPTSYLLMVNFCLLELAYDVSDESHILCLFVIAVTVVSLLWGSKLLETSLSQILAIVAVFTWPFSVLGSYGIDGFLWNELLFVRISAGFATVMLLQYIPSAFPRSFSPNELCVNVQLVVPFLSSSVACLLDNLFHLKFSLCGHSGYMRVIHFLSLGVALFVVICQIAILRLRWRKKSLLVFAALAISVLLTYLTLFSSLRDEPIQWLFRFLTRSRSRRMLIWKWAGCLVINVIFAAFWTWTTTGSAGTKIRKIFHVGVSTVFVVGIKEDPDLLTFCSASLLLVFVVLECWRVFKVRPISSLLERCVSAFRDSQDAGILTLTHIYLLVGASLPLWLLPAGNAVSLTTYSGIISVGVGDTAASVVGSYGRVHWSKSKKTVEGTFAAVIAQLLASVAIWYYLNPSLLMSVQEVLILTLVSAVVAVIEAKIPDIDNLVLPIYHHTLMLIAKLYYPRL